MSEEVNVSVIVADDPVVSVQIKEPPVVTTVLQIGAPGPQGEQGEQGEPGASSLAYPYRWKDQIDESDPADGYVKSNNTDEALATELYISAHDRNGQGFLPILSLQVGDDIFLYEAGQISTWNRYMLTGPVESHGSPIDWATLPVTYVETGPLPFTPNTGTSVLVYIPVPATGVPAGGTEGQILSKVDGTDYNVEWITVPEITVGPTPPSSPDLNDVWIDTT